jgi:hypothetical protein
MSIVMNSIYISIAFKIFLLFSAKDAFLQTIYLKVNLFYGILR